MENSTGGLKLAAAVIIVAVIIAMAFGILSRGTNLFNTGTKQLDGSLSGLSNADKQIYDNSSLTGSEVITCIKKYLETDGMYVIVATKAGNLRAYNGSFAYVNPTDTAPATTAVDTMNAYRANCVNGLKTVKLGKTTTLLKDDGDWAATMTYAGTDDGNYDASIPATDAAYISTSATYKSTIHVDQNNDVRFIVFVQQ